MATTENESQPAGNLGSSTEISGDNKQLRGEGKLLTSLGYLRIQNVYHHFLDQAVSTNERDHEFYSVPLV